jgi:hypothetical protein
MSGSGVDVAAATSYTVPPRRRDDATTRSHRSQRRAHTALACTGDAPSVSPLQHDARGCRIDNAQDVSSSAAIRAAHDSHGRDKSCIDGRQAWREYATATPFRSREHHTLVVGAGLCEDGAAVHHNAREGTASHRVEHLAAGTEHNNAAVAVVSDDDLVKGRARDALGTAELADTHVADELALHAEHAHAAVAVVGDCDVTVPGHEAQSTWVLQLTVAAALRSEATKKSAVTPLEHTDAVGISL